MWRTFLLRFFSMLSTAKTCSPAAGSSIFRYKRRGSVFFSFSLSLFLLLVSDTLSSVFRQFFFSPCCSSDVKHKSPPPPRILTASLPSLSPSERLVLQASWSCSKKTLHANSRWRDVRGGGGNRGGGCSRAAFRRFRKWWNHDFGRLWTICNKAVNDDNYDGGKVRVFHDKWYTKAWHLVRGMTAVWRDGFYYTLTAVWASPRQALGVSTLLLIEASVITSLCYAMVT